jgi:hypothetical protein
MPDSITINTNDLNANTIAAIRERFGKDVELTIRPQLPQDRSITEESAAWALIDLLDWEGTTDDEIVAPLVERLQQLSIGEIYRFNDWLAKKLYLLDTPAHAAAWQQGEESLSVDDFLYARCAVIANGADYYTQVLAHPEEMPTEVTFEPLLYVTYRAYKQKTGEELVYVPLFNYETYGNRNAWGT